MRAWTQEEYELFSWRYRHKISIGSFKYADRVEFWVNYAVGRDWPSWSNRLWIWEVAP